jgi:hypothetical protein
MPPNPSPQSTADPAAFIARWQQSGATERANYQHFLSELCDVRGVPRPDPTTPTPGRPYDAAIPPSGR